MASPPTTAQLNDHHTNLVLKLESRGPGSYDLCTALRGQGLLSSLFVKSVAAGATLTVEYYEATIDPHGVEFLSLKSHAAIDDTTPLPLTNRICVPKLHRQVRAKITVTGGAVEFGLTQSARDVSVLDSILEAGDGIQIEELGEEHHDIKTVPITPGSFVDVLTETIPAGITRRYKNVGVSCVTSGEWQLTFDGTKVASGRTSPSNPDSFRKLDPRKSAPSGVEVKIIFRARVGGPTNDVDGHVMALDIPM